MLHNSKKDQYKPIPKEAGPIVHWLSSPLVHQLQKKSQLGVFNAGQCKIKTDTIERFN